MISTQELGAHAERAARKQGAVLVFEGLVGNRWTVLAIQKLGDAPASISHNHDGIRDIYVTQVYEDHGTISKMPIGIDVKAGRERMLDIDDVKHAAVLHRLAPGEAVELELKPDRAPASRKVRYRYETRTPT